MSIDWPESNPLIAQPITNAGSLLYKGNTLLNEVVDPARVEGLYRKPNQLQFATGYVELC